jgi:geranylgeranyl pyrophosphate synthase
VLQLFSDCKVADWANELKEQYFKKAMASLEAINVLSNRKSELEKLARFLLDRDV